MVFWPMMAAALAGAALAGMAAVARTALRHGHLLVLRGPDGAPRLYERGGDRWYAPLSLARLPAALRRFLCGTPARVRVRVRAKHGNRMHFCKEDGR